MDKILSLATTTATTKWMNLEIDMLTKISQAQRQVPHSLTPMWNLKQLISYKLRVGWWLLEVEVSRVVGRMGRG